VADTIHKSKSTVAKYETGDLGIDVDTLYQFSEALNVPVDQLLVPQIWVSDNTAADIHLPEYYKGRKLYAYFWDGRNSTLNTSVLTIGQQSEEIPYQYQAMLYMNVTDIDNPYLCENTYIGTIEFHHVLVNLSVRHRDTPVERLMVDILENFSNRGVKWGRAASISFRPFAPVAYKMLFSQTPLSFTGDDVKKLMFSKEELKKLRQNNILFVTQD